MHGVQLQRAIEDLLEYCRNPHRALNEGRHLAPWLLGREWHDEQDDARLVAALEALLESELNQLRQQFGVQAHAADGTPTVDAQVQADIAVNNKRLAALSLTWMYYMDGVATEHLATIINATQRTVQLKIKDGRVQLAALMERQATTATPRGNGQHDESATPNNPSVNAAPHYADPPETAADQRRSTQTISGSHVQAMQGSVSGSVHQEQHIHHHTAPTPAPRSQADVGLFQVSVLALLAAGFWIMQTAPWIGIGALFTLSAWRVARHSWRAAQLWSMPSDADTRWWYSGYGAAWLGVLAWSMGLAAYQARAADDVLGFGLARLIAVVIFLGICLVAFWLSTVDLLLWVDRTLEVGWPLRLLQTRAAWCWQQRWLFLGLTWLMLGVCSASALAFLLMAS